MNTNLDDLLGKPFRYGGRGPDAFDCYNLFIECSRRNGLPLPPDYPRPEDQNHDATVLASMENGWEQREAPTAGLAVLLKMDGHFHIGYVEDENWFLHVLMDANVVRSNLHRPPWKNRVVGFYKWISDDKTSHD